MSLGSRLRRDFSPYEIAVMGWVLSYALAIIGLVAFAYGRTGVGLVLLMSAPILLLTFAGMSRCPVCEKEPLKRSKEGVLWSLLYGPLFNYRFRLWPERECSECRYRLDNEPPFDDRS